MADAAARKYIHARIAAPPSGGERRKLFVILARKVSANLEQLRPHHVVVIAQPLFGGRLCRVLPVALRKFSVNFLETLGIALELPKQLTARGAAAGGAMLGGDFACVNLELLEGQRRAWPWRSSSASEPDELRSCWMSEGLHYRLALHACTAMHGLNLMVPEFKSRLYGSSRTEQK